MIFFSIRNFCLPPIFFVLIVLTQSCNKEIKDAQHHLTPEDDAKIGKAIDNAFLTFIDTCPDISYLDASANTFIYSYINQFSLKIKGSNNYTSSVSTLSTTNAIDVPTIRILDKPGNTGAFVAPGGYIYIYNDLLKTLNYEAQFVPLLAHLITCSAKRYDIEKLEAQFSPNFLIDLADGGTINGSSSTNIQSILSVLEDTPYPKNLVDNLDEKAEQITCELGYDIQAYSDLFTQNSTRSIKWIQLFPRTFSSGDYAAHLFNEVSDSLSCGGTIIEGGYPQFKNYLN